MHLLYGEQCFASVMCQARSLSMHSAAACSAMNQSILRMHAHAQVLSDPGSALLCVCACRYGTNILSAAATPDLSYIVGGCMDSCVHIWHFQSSPEAAAAARMQATVNADQGVVDQAAPPSDQELVEYSCGGYTSKVTHIVYNSTATMLATTGGTQCTVWDFKGPQGPAGSTPVVCLGHTKTVTCQVGSCLTPDTQLAAEHELLSQTGWHC